MAQIAMISDHRGASEAPALASVESEAALLGALMCETGLIDVICDKVDADDFFEPVHQRIYAAILESTAAGKSPGPATLVPLFKGDPAFDHLGGVGYLAVLTSGGKIAHIGAHGFARQIADLAARRRLIAELAIASSSAADCNNLLADVVNQSDAALVAAIERRESMAQPTGGECVASAIARIEAIRASSGRIGVSTGISDLDDLLGGFEPGQLIIMAARPGMGKTAVACSAALGMAKQGAGVLFVSLEMNGSELGMRMVTDHCFQDGRGIPFSRVVDADLSDGQMRLLCRAQDQIKPYPLRVADSGSVTMSRLSLGIRRTKRRMKAEGVDLKVVIIDYLQLLHPDSKTKSAYEAVSEISRGLKALSKDAGVTILALAQLSRAVETREDKRPQLSDLRDSGQIEQDADAVVFLYREEYYLERAKPKSGVEAQHEDMLAQARNRISLICAKRRNGRVGERLAWYFPTYQAVRGSREMEALEGML